MTIKVPDDLYREAALIADARKVSVDEIFISAFAEHIRARDHIKARAARGDRQKFLAVLDKVPNVEPDENDRR